MATAPAIPERSALRAISPALAAPAAVYAPKAKRKLSSASQIANEGNDFFKKSSVLSQLRANMSSTEASSSIHGPLATSPDLAGGGPSLSSIYPFFQGLSGLDGPATPASINPFHDPLSGGSTMTIDQPAMGGAVIFDQPAISNFSRPSTSKERRLRQEAKHPMATSIRAKRANGRNQRDEPPPRHFKDQDTDMELSVPTGWLFWLLFCVPVVSLTSMAAATGVLVQMIVSGIPIPVDSGIVYWLMGSIFVLFIGVMSFVQTTNLRIRHVEEKPLSISDPILVGVGVNMHAGATPEELQLSLDWLACHLSDQNPSCTVNYHHHPDRVTEHEHDFRQVIVKVKPNRPRVFSIQSEINQSRTVRIVDIYGRDQLQGIEMQDMGNLTGTGTDSIFNSSHAHRNCHASDWPLRSSSLNTPLPSSPSSGNFVSAGDIDA